MQFQCRCSEVILPLWDHNDSWKREEEKSVNVMLYVYAYAWKELYYTMENGSLKVSSQKIRWCTELWISSTLRVSGTIRNRMTQSGFRQLWHLTMLIWWNRYSQWILLSTNQASKTHPSSDYLGRRCFSSHTWRSLPSEEVRPHMTRSRYSKGGTVK